MYICVAACLLVSGALAVIALVRSSMLNVCFLVWVIAEVFVSQVSILKFSVFRTVTSSLSQYLY